MLSKRLSWALSKATKIIPKIVKNGESPGETKKSLTVKWETLKMKITKLPETNAGPETHQAVACLRFRQSTDTGVSFQEGWKE